jgi:hypothetical protein
MLLALTIASWSLDVGTTHAVGVPHDCRCRINCAGDCCCVKKEKATRGTSKKAVDVAAQPAGTCLLSPRPCGDDASTTNAPNSIGRVDRFPFPVGVPDLDPACHGRLVISGPRPHAHLISTPPDEPPEGPSA